MTIDEMKERKRTLGYSFRQLSEASGLPVGTIQKIFTGETKNPRFHTRQALENVLKKDAGTTDGHLTEEIEYIKKILNSDATGIVREPDTYYAPDRRRITSEEFMSTDYHFRDDGFLEGPYTYQDYLRLPEDMKVELIYGVFYEMASPRYAHQKIVSDLIYQLMGEIERLKMNCDVIGSMDTRIQKDNKTVVQPDISVLCHPEDRLKKDTIWGASDLVIEVLSPSTKSRDMNIKMKLYRESGIREYWMIDPDEKLLFQIIFGEKEVLHMHRFNEIIDVEISEGRIHIDLNRINYQS